MLYTLAVRCLRFRGRRGGAACFFCLPKFRRSNSSSHNIHGLGDCALSEVLLLSADALFTSTSFLLASITLVLVLALLPLLFPNDAPF